MSVRQRIETHIALGQRRLLAADSTAVLTIRVPCAVRDRLRELKAAEQVSVNRLCVAAIEEALEQLNGGGASVSEVGGRESEVRRPGGKSCQCA